MAFAFRFSPTLDQGSALRAPPGQAPTLSLSLGRPGPRARPQAQLAYQSGHPEGIAVDPHNVEDADELGVLVYVEPQ